MAEPVTGTQQADRARSRHASTSTQGGSARPKAAETIRPETIRPGTIQPETTQPNTARRAQPGTPAQPRQDSAPAGDRPTRTTPHGETRHTRPSPPERSKSRKGKSAVDAWMDQEVTIRGRIVKRQKITLWLIGFPAFVPLLFMSSAVITLNKPTMNGAVADVLGTGAEACLLLALLITPMATVTRQRWFVPLRRWFGVMMAVTAICDATIAALTTSFAGGIVGRLAGHSFLLAGLMMVVIAIPLLAIANNRAQKWLGRYWKPLQRMTYVIWGLLFLHLALLFGFRLDSGESDDGDPFFHNRLVQLTLCSIPLLLLRLPPVRRWIAKQQRAGRQWLVYAVCVPLAILFVLGFGFIVNEEIFKGSAAFTLHPHLD